MRILYFDCFNGASGDMILGALLDAGLPLQALRDALGSLGLAEYELAADRVLRARVSATQFRLIERANTVIRTTTTTSTNTHTSTAATVTHTTHRAPRTTHLRTTTLTAACRKSSR